MTRPSLTAKNIMALFSGDLGAEPVPISASNPLPVSSSAPAGLVTTSTTIIRPNDTAVYAPGDAFADSTSAPTAGGFTMANVVRAAGKSAILTDLLVVSSNNSATPLQGEVMIFDAAVTAVNDNAALGVSDVEIGTLVAVVPFAMTQGANNNRAHMQNLNIGITTVGNTNLRFLIRVTNAYTPAALEGIAVRAKFLPVD